MTVSATSRRIFILWLLATFIVLSVVLQFTSPQLFPATSWLPPTTQQRPKQPPPLKHNIRTNSTKSVHDTPVTIHIVFSTSCTDQQHWESFVFFYHAMKVKQPGHVTRIVAACDRPELTAELYRFHNTYIQPMSRNFHVHVTPDFAMVRKQGSDSLQHYKYMNKPFGLRHWMEHTLLGIGNHVNNSTETFRRSNSRSKQLADDDVVVIMDPDMILLRPILHDYSHEKNIIWVKDHPDTKRVRHGFPMAQHDGYLENMWMKLNYSYIMQDNNATIVSPEDGPLYFNAGPPYLATVRDMHRIAILWTAYAPRVYDLYPELFAEMYGYIFASVRLKLRHTMIKSLVVSLTTAVNREGWPMVDNLTDNQLCPPEQYQRSSTQLLNLPFVLHYCQRYHAGPWFFSKYRLKRNFISCPARLMAMPPHNTSQYDYWITPPKAWDPAGLSNLSSDRNNLKNRQEAKREAFMLCGLISAVNEASRYFKQQYCPNNTANWDNTYTVHNSPADY